MVNPNACIYPAFCFFLVPGAALDTVVTLAGDTFAIPPDLIDAE